MTNFTDITDLSDTVLDSYLDLIGAGYKVTVEWSCRDMAKLIVDGVEVGLERGRGFITYEERAKFKKAVPGDGACWTDGDKVLDILKVLNA